MPQINKCRNKPYHVAGVEYEFSGEVLSEDVSDS